MVWLAVAALPHPSVAVHVRVTENSFAQRPGACTSLNVSWAVPLQSSVATTIECPATPSFATASATDACDASPRLSFDDRTTAGSCPGQYSITRTWTATDACGNTSTASQVINVADHTAPVVSCPNDTTVGACQNPVYFSVQANDACGGPVSIVATPASGSNFPVGDNIV